MSTPQTTTMFDAVGYLLTTFTNDSQLGGSGIDVFEGEPARDADRQVIAIGEAIAGDEDWAGLGATATDEHYTISVYIQIADPGMSRADIRQRMKAIYSRCQVLIRQDPTLGLSNPNTSIGTVRNAKVSTPSYMPYPETEGFGGNLIFDVHVEAYLGVI